VANRKDLGLAANVECHKSDKLEELLGQFSPEEGGQLTN
jgi:hypothetical protein